MDEFEAFVRSVEPRLRRALVAARGSRSRRRKVALLPATIVTDRLPEVDPRLHDLVRALPVQQRVTVLLVHGFEWTHGEVAELLGLSPSTVSTHVQRGMATLRQRLEVTGDA